MYIDCHTHAFADKIADKAVTQLINYYSMPTVFGGRFADLMAVADKAGLDAMILLVAATKPEQVHPANDWALSLQQLSTNRLKQEYDLKKNLRIIPFGTFHPDDPNWRAEISRLRAAGIQGLKLHPEFQSIDLGDPKLDDFWAEIESDFIVMIHVGDPTVSPANYSTPFKVARILDKFPRLRLIAAHLGGLYFWEEAITELVGRNVYLDTSSALSFIDPDLLRRILSRHSREMILFGSDYPLCAPWEDRAILERLDWLTERDRELIFGENCARLLGIAG